jgi:hypothetical protein
VGITNPAVQPPAPGAATSPNQVGSSNLSFTNSAGGVYSVDQLAGQLQNLRASIDQTLPMLTAFTQTYSNAVSGGKTTVSGAISGIISKVLKETNAPNATAQNAAWGTNLLAALQQSLNRNAPAPAATPTRAEDVAALQQQLQPVPGMLQRMNVGGSTNQLAAPGGTISQPSPGQPTPTGR